VTHQPSPPFSENKPRIYVAGKMDYTPYHWKWTSVISDDLRNEIKNDYVEYIYPTDIAGKHGGDLIEGIAECCIHSTQYCNGLIAILSKEHQPGTTAEIFEAFRQDIPILLIDVTGSWTEDHLFSECICESDSKYWFIHNTLKYLKVEPSNIFSYHITNHEKIPNIIKNWSINIIAKKRCGENVFSLYNKFNQKWENIPDKYMITGDYYNKYLVWEKLLINYYCYDFTCEYCGIKLRIHDKDKGRKSFSLEHKVPLSKGGTNDPDNIAITCWRCNKIKGTVTEETFKKLIDATNGDEELLNNLFDEMLLGRTAAYNEARRLGEL